MKQILDGVEYKRSTGRTITTTEALLPVLDKVREQGYGEDNEEQEEGLRCIGVPVFDRFGVVIAGLSISFPTLRFLKKNCMTTFRCCIPRRVKSLSRWVTTIIRSDDVMLSIVKKRPAFSPAALIL